MHHADEMTREKDEGEQRTSPPDNIDVPSTESESGSDGLPSTGEVVIVDFEPGEPADPHNWNIAKKLYVIFVGSILSINSTMGSSLPSNESSALQAYFGFPDGMQTVLPATMYLIGFVLGPLVFAPLSEQHGRRPILLGTLLLYLIFTMACALAPNWAAFLVFRFFCGTFAAPPMSVTGGSIADVYSDKVERGRANMLWSAATLVGPLGGPVISGYTYQYSWRWGFWAAMMLSGICFVALFLQPETLATKILRDRAKKLNKEKGSEKYIAPADQHRLGVLETLMIFMALINYIADAYGIFASSALAACAATRSIAGAVIPLAVDKMVSTLGIAWACSVLALISCALSLVPFGFIIWGEKIRAGSNFSKTLQNDPHPELELTRSISLA
ncbi:hypothetical protein SLS53_001415 [Cytospora paraplurivora]|uniref:Major facilitator superfamily (MFS) profile domain-containing protein n=1 Tax=Cytospora paraplurivora TaxID=2898453 RepID=A0AAN9YMV1_9PEZI